jgi:hypothetical protein
VRTRSWSWRGWRHAANPTALPRPPTLWLSCCSNLCAIHAKRVTIQVKDIQLARRIRGLQDITG